jgi:pre-mRNA-splicing factor CWC26
VKFEVQASSNLSRYASPLNSTVPIMSLADYLAKNYLTADPVPEKKKKKKRKDKAVESGLVIADDDVLGWTKDTGRGDDEDGPLTG